LFISRIPFEGFFSHAIPDNLPACVTIILSSVALAR